MPNVATNPFPEHGIVNMITKDENLIMDILKVKTLLVSVHLKLFKAGILKQDHEKCFICLRDPKGCFDVQKDIKMLISNGVLQVSGKKKNNEVFMIVPIFNKPMAFEILCPLKESTPLDDSARCLNIKILAPFPYKSDKVVPWGYEPTTIMNGVEKPLVNNKVVTNISDASGLTRRGRVFTPVILRSGKPVVEKPNNVKAPLVIPESRPIQDVEAGEFLRLIQKSDYKVVDQLLQTQSKIFVMSLLLNSEAHRKALLKFLGKAYVNPNVTVDHFDHVVGNITCCNILSFSDNALPAEGKKYNNALYISMGYEKDSLSHAAVDIDSSLNVMPKINLAMLFYIGAEIRPSEVVVKGFDGSKRTVMGEIVLPMMVGLQQFQILFQGMEINPGYSCLLGRPWIHDACVVTSTLHHELKFIRNGKLAIVYGEQVLMISQLSSFRYIDVEKDVVITQFQGLEIANAVRIEDLDEDKVGTSMASLKDEQQVVASGQTLGWGKIV
ncbi:uncharacterized protein LOC127122059 [Lathyrus oleraceus]|uniref:uncharacterized protein LOC127122059 n=1 Tax=Pisum sativum TaxID=3888 RepID=UPI0021CFA159|nr:uncharacterized protein LOC127122059 [Pisum sativum]